ncbi:hypothetical protein HPB50_011336 [Hyalomma asiaticum]|uniref:Uncharacterized protein n=1 Tax=Hyalomma asiaticum TaxID=266040 RepID=A0ACB7RLH2_HYAAI|nr:hypothetical protein HPB50_011336 [Hyalomma asiaticum]
MEFHSLDADIQAFILKGIEDYGIVGTPGNYAWSTPLIMKYGVELAYEDLVPTEKDLASTDFVHNAATLAKILSIRPLVRKLRIGDIDVPGFEAAFRTREQCPSLKEVCMGIFDQKCEPLRLNECGAFQSLCSLYLGADSTEPAYAEDIASYVAQNRSLKELTLSMSCGGDEGIAILLEAFKVQTIEKGFETNYTLTKLDFGHGEDEDEMGRIGEYLRRNITLENKAAMCVTSGVDLSDETSMLALKKNLCSLHLSAIDTEPAYGEDIASYVAYNKSLKELTLGTSCGGEEGMVMLVEALKLNDTLKRFSLYEIETELSYETLISFAKILSFNSTLELVSLNSIYDVEEDQVSSCLDQDLYPGAFNKLDIKWPQSLFIELIGLIRKQGCAPLLHIRVPSCAGKKYIRQFFEALAPVTALRELHLSDIDMCDAFTDGIAYLLKCTATLRKFMISTDVDANEEHHLMNIFESLKRNRSVTKFEIKYSVLTPRIAASMSELISVNSTLNDLAVIVDGPLMPEPVKVIEKGFDTNYTLTKLFLGRYDEVMGDIPRLLKRNISLENKAALWVIHGVDQIDEAGVDALKKVHFGSGLVEKVQMITGRTRQDALDDIQRAVAHLCQ